MHWNFLLKALFYCFFMEIYLHNGKEDSPFLRSFSVSPQQKRKLDSDFEKIVCSSNPFKDKQTDSLIFSRDWFIYTFDSEGKLIGIDMKDEGDDYVKVKLEKFKNMISQDIGCDFSPDQRITISCEKNFIYLPYSVIKVVPKSLRKYGIHSLVSNYLLEKGLKDLPGSNNCDKYFYSSEFLLKNFN